MNNKPFRKTYKDKAVIYEYVRGSHCHGIETEESDIDLGGVFIEQNVMLLGLGIGYKDEVKNESNDEVYWELKKFIRLLSESNPTAIEALFVDDEFVTVEDPVITEIKKNRDMFLTKKCFKPFGNYAIEQIHKARGLNKKIINPITERKWPLDFCYTFYKQGSTCVRRWLEYRGMKQKYCGLAGIPNMHDCYGVYYDWGNHFANENVDWETISVAYKAIENPQTEMDRFVAFFCEYFKVSDISELKYQFENCKPIGYRGIVDEDGKSNSVRMSSVEKGVVPIFHMNYNADGYTSHCKKYKEYQEWVEKRNKTRYESTLIKNYDAKKMCESIRLVTLCTEIARDGVVRLNRKNIDRDFLLSVKRHEYEYDELMARLVDVEKEMEEAIKNSTLPDGVPVEYFDDLLKNIRLNFVF